MSIMIPIYVLLLLLGLAYAGINIFHVIRFRLPGDNSYLAISIYGVILAGVIISSVSLAIIASQF
ncbi:TPA: hypothetical protein DHW58_00320 [Patescibacteria group bacterium]|uniref:Uncharacterized protein n=2 Tax=Bacteria division Kazan-3B-28 TaxID=1798534 RepID=A0A0G1ZGW8_UNCK3|nr:MAG: hypothetical protein VE98_C0001G0468 [candidate division Kazan bacterium GW2011_GWA1_50_15]KKW25844.1 MAG: hypothetical protein VE99_C0001G0483 [candidate division Kazan bacterium GW2011_GWC1_52_13]KKW27142.1 MAG: hypothetical protein VF00_C0001G0077 [candidate division Kazan bacterium GW2011_GWB1_52_7]HCL47423.1 hypothetical protein [Patescibacteria group bacterium]HCR42430.1 hypothetical protein [Patescibacteria group bacterium]